MATSNTIIGSAAMPAPLRVPRAGTFRCAYSKEGLKACSAMNLSPAALKGLGLRRVSRPWGSKLVEEPSDNEDTRPRWLSRALNPEDMRLWRLSRALNPEWVLACVLGYIFFNPRRLRHYYDNQNSGGLTL